MTTVTRGSTDSNGTNTPSSIAIIKTSVVNDGADNIARAGETISYSFSATNTGTTTLTNIRVTDPLLTNGSGARNTITGGPVASLAPGLQLQPLVVFIHLHRRTILIQEVVQIRQRQVHHQVVQM
jgi:uncharacterized repeat protein (TIGR01451 family)